MTVCQLLAFLLSPHFRSSNPIQPGHNVETFDCVCDLVWPTFLIHTSIYVRRWPGSQWPGLPWETSSCWIKSVYFRLVSQHKDFFRAVTSTTLCPLVVKCVVEKNFFLGKPTWSWFACCARPWLSNWDGAEDAVPGHLGLFASHRASLGKWLPPLKLFRKSIHIGEQSIPYRGGTFSCLRTSSLKIKDQCVEWEAVAHPENPSITAVLSPAAVAARRKWSARKPTYIDQNITLAYPHCQMKAYTCR